MADKKEPLTSKKMLAAEESEKDRPTHPMLVLVAGFVSAILLFFCCACSGAMWWFRPEIYEDPDRAMQLTQEIVEIHIPDSYQPKGTIELNAAYLMSIRGVYYERFAGDGLLTLIEINSQFRSDEDVQRHIRKTLMEKGGGGTPLVVDESKTVRLPIDVQGEEVLFVFEVGQDPPTRKKYHLVEGAFPGKNGEVLLSMRVNEDNWEESSILEMIRSIGSLPGKNQGMILNPTPAATD